MSPPSYPSAWLHPCRARFRFTWQCHCNAPAGGCLLPSFLPLLARFFQLVVTRRMDLGLAPRQHICWRDESNGAVQTDGVVVLDVLLDQMLTILRRRRRSWPDALACKITSISASVIDSRRIGFSTSTDNGYADCSNRSDPQDRLAPAAPATQNIEALRLLDQFRLRRMRRW
jgi:hypothetical protein